LKKLFPLIALVVFVFLSSCNPFAAGEIRERAKADQIAAQTLQESLNQEQVRKFAEDQHAFEVQEAARVQTIKDSVVETAKQTANLIVRVGGFILLVSVCTLALGTTLTVNSTLKGIGEAAVIAANIQARLIYLDEKTGHFPVFVYEGHGKGTLVNSNVQGALPMDTRHEPDRQMIANSGAAIVTMLATNAAAKSEDPAGVSVFRPQPIDVTPEMTNYAKVISEVDYE
jgi:hypothetical protein